MASLRKTAGILLFSLGILFFTVGFIEGYFWEDQLKYGYSHYSQSIPVAPVSTSNTVSSANNFLDKLHSLSPRSRISLFSGTGFMFILLAWIIFPNKEDETY